MMRRDQGTKLPFPSPLRQSPVADRARLLLDGACRWKIPLDGQDCVRNAKPFTDVRDHFGFFAASGTQTVVHCRRLDLARAGGGGEHEKRQAVRSA